MALDDAVFVDDFEFRVVGRDSQFVAGDYADEAKERAGGFPAFGAAAGVVEGYIGGELDFDGGVFAVAD